MAVQFLPEIWTTEISGTLDDAVVRFRCPIAHHFLRPLILFIFHQTGMSFWQQTIPTTSNNATQERHQPYQVY
jgi:hypothetical protein